VKLVAVSQRVDLYPERNERRDALDQRLGAFLLTADLLPVPIPNCFFTGPAESATGSLMAWLEAIDPLGFVLSGGNDIGTLGERDLLEHHLLDYAKENSTPTLGICRGMQMMGVWADTSLKPVASHVRARHELDGEISGEVNSYHNLALTQCPPEFAVIARSKDSEIEAIRHSKLPWEGWMWHPEREEPYRSQDIVRLRALFDT
jgi:N5-(cytidine 5'-diphosphoramidyl)-L-glutamine hydrolase